MTRKRQEQLTLPEMPKMTRGKKGESIDSIQAQPANEESQDEETIPPRTQVKECSNHDEETQYN